MLSLKNPEITAVPLISLILSGSFYVSCQGSLAQTKLPELQPAGEFYGSYQDRERLARYIVYIDSDNLQILKQAQKIDSNAYIRSLNQRRVIQSGVFNELFNAQKRLQELELNGINGGRIMTYYYPLENRQDNPGISEVKYYYVIIPTRRENLQLLGQEIRSKIEGNTNVFIRTEPRGYHVAIGGFRERQEAEQWNNYLRNLGYGNARVYYGK